MRLFVRTDIRIIIGLVVALLEVLCKKLILCALLAPDAMVTTASYFRVFCMTHQWLAEPFSHIYTSKESPI